MPVEVVGVLLMAELEVQADQAGVVMQQLRQAE
jgi:hypothetical protein